MERALQPRSTHVETAANIPPGSRSDRRRNGRVKDATKSRVANGSALFSGRIDHRSTWIKRVRETIADHLSDLGGIENTSAAEQSIIRRVSALTVECERLERTFALLGEDDPADREALDLYRKLADSLRRSLESLHVGLGRRAREVAALPPATSDHGRARASELRGRLIEGEADADG